MKKDIKRAQYPVDAALRPQLPLFYNYILFNEMLPRSVDLMYMRNIPKWQSRESYHPFSKSISKPIDLSEFKN